MIITLDVFSGRPNPLWVLSQSDARELIDRIAKRSVIEAQTVDNVLGYRGFVVSAASDEQLPENLPASFRIGGGLPKGYALPESAAPPLSADEISDATGWLLSTGSHVVDEDVVAFVQDAVRMRAQGLDTRAPAEAPEEAPEALPRPLPPCVIQNTPYNPGFWNTPAVQPHNNCYNYSMNYRSDTFAQPGRISGHMYTAINCANVGTAANWDGCKTTCSGSNKNVALVIWPGTDYHWYRRHSNGFWGHKPGGTAARNVDNRGRLIDGTHLTPANCDRGPYTIFCGYRYSPTGMHVR